MMRWRYLRVFIWLLAIVFIFVVVTGEMPYWIGILGVAIYGPIVKLVEDKHRKIAIEYYKSEGISEDKAKPRVDWEYPATKRGFEVDKIDD